MQVIDQIEPKNRYKTETTPATSTNPWIKRTYFTYFALVSLKMEAPKSWNCGEKETVEGMEFSTVGR